MIRITFYVYDPAIAFLAGVHNGAAAYCTITADRGGFLGVPCFEHLGVGFNRAQIKSQATDGYTGSRSAGDLFRGIPG